MTRTTYLIHDGGRTDATTDTDRAEQASRDGKRVTAVAEGGR